MTSGFIRRRTTLTVGRRLFLGLLPALLAVLLAVSLAYYGEYGRSAPNVLVFGATVLAIISLVVTWVNTRYLAARIARLSGTVDASNDRAAESGASDEFDRIERVVDHLGSALSASEAERARADAAATTRLRAEATMLAAVVRDTTAQLDELRLPLHILLETRFGDLNENQEELLRDARTAADAVGSALRRLSQLADADRGALPIQREPVQVNDVVRAILPLARAAAERRKARVDAQLEPALPRVMADRARLAEALALLANEAAVETGPDRPLVLGTTRDNGGVAITVGPVSDPGATILARRLIAAQGGETETQAGPAVLVVRLGSRHHA